MFDLQKLIRPNLLNLKPYSSARDEYSGSLGIFLDANENPFGERNRYPDPHQTRLKKKLGGLKSISWENIFIGNGSDEAIDLLYRLFCRPGLDKALTFSPSYGMYEVSAAIHDVELIKLPLATDFQINPEPLKPYLSDPLVKLIFICSPNNPTGNTMNNLEEILEKFIGIVVIDEAYIDFSSSPSWTQKLGHFPNLVVLQTFSKAWGLAAARVGMAFASRSIVDFLNKIKPPYNVSSLNQMAALEVLNDVSGFEERKNQILAQRKWLQENLKINPLVTHVYDSEANFLLVETLDANRIYEALVLQNVITRNRHTVINNCIRITVGTPEENQTLISALQKCSL